MLSLRPPSAPFGQRHRNSAIATRFVSHFAAAILGLALTACGTDSAFEKPPKIDSFQQAATVHVAPLSIVSWNEYVDTLQAQFPITPASALSLALPKTSISQAAYADILSGQLQVGLPQSTSTRASNQALSTGLNTNSGATATTGSTLGNSFTKTAAANNSTTDQNNSQTTNSAASNGASLNTSVANNANTTTTSTVATNGSTTTTQTTTTQQGPGTLPPNLLPAVTAPNATTLNAPTGSIALDPMLTYQAAMAIYQEIQLLNAYVRNAALRHGYVPYLVTMQVSVVPFAHNEQYDTYVNLGFFSRCHVSNGKGSSVVHEYPAIAVPLLVTDDVETGQSSSASNIARQLALSLGGVTGNVALQAGLSDLKDAFKAILGTDYNSLYMVTRAADNVIQVRLGAARSANPNVQYAMLTQTHDVSFVLLVKKAGAPDWSRCESDAGPIVPKPGGKGAGRRRGVGAPDIWVTSSSRFRNALTGIELAPDRNAIQTDAVTMLQRFAKYSPAAPPKFSYEHDVDPLLGDIQGGDFEDFENNACKVLTPEKAAHEKCAGGPYEALWTSLTSVINMSEFAGTKIELPHARSLQPDRSQSIYLSDNCKDTVTAQVYVAGTLVPNQYEADLFLNKKLALAATSLVQQAGGGPVTLQFASLASLQSVLRSLDSTHEAAAIKAACATSSTKGKAGSAAAPPVPLMVRFPSARLRIRQVLDGRWTGEGRPPYRFRTIYYSGQPSHSGSSVSLATAADSILSVPNSGAPQLGGLGQVRVFVNGSSDLQDIVLSFRGAVLAAVPARGDVTAVETSPQPAASLKISPGASGKFGSSPVVVDVLLEGLISGRTVTVTATGDSKSGGAGAVQTIAIPVVDASAKASANAGRQ